jgi:hypothetical protein
MVVKFGDKNLIIVVLVVVDQEEKELGHVLNAHTTKDVPKLW